MTKESLSELHGIFSECSVPNKSQVDGIKLYPTHAWKETWMGLSQVLGVPVDSVIKEGNVL